MQSDQNKHVVQLVEPLQEFVLVPKEVISKITQAEVPTIMID